MAAIFFVAVVGVVLLVLQPFPVLHDYPEWMYQGHIVWSLLADKSTYAAHYELVLVPVPNAISQVAIAILNFVVSPVMAGKIWLAIYLLLALAVSAYGTRRHQQSGAKQLIFLITIAFGPGFFNGYLNFQFGVLFFALFVVLESQWDQSVRTRSQQSIVRILIFSLLIYFSHASVFAGFVIYVVLFEIFNQRRLTVALALLPSFVLLLWYSAVKLVSDSNFNDRAGSLVQWAQYKIYTLAKQGPFHNFILSDGQSLLTDLHRLYLTGFVLNFIVAVLIGCWLLACVWGRFQQRDLSINENFRSDALFLTIVFLVGLWLLAGSNTFGVVNLGERFLIVALMLSLFQVKMPRWVLVGWASVCAFSGVVTVVSLMALSQNTDSYSVNRSAESIGLSSFVDEIYSKSRHNYFNHRLFIYANLGHYLMQPEKFDEPLPVDHESSIVRMLENSTDL